MLGGDGHAIEKRSSQGDSKLLKISAINIKSIYFLFEGNVFFLNIFPYSR